MFRRPMTWILTLVGLCLVGCGPIQFVSQVTLRAEKAVAAAKLRHSDRYAPYEYFGAEAYLEQAKYRAAYGDFQEAYRYGKKSEAMADKAVSLTKRRMEEESDKVRPGDPGTGAPREVAPPEERR